MKKKKPANNFFQLSLIRIIVFVIIAGISISVGLIFKAPIEAYLNNNSIEQKAIDENGLSVHFIDVGQGDSIFIEFPDNKTMLIDAGPSSSANIITNYINNLQITENNVINYVLLTHSDEDHCGAMPNVMNMFDVQMIIRPKIFSSRISGDGEDFLGNKLLSDTLAYANAINAFNAENCPIIFADKQALNSTSKIEGGINDTYYQLVFYAPTENYYSSSNDYSPIFVIEYNNKKIMFTGDASTSSENLVMSETEFPVVDVLKVAHHGSSSSTSLDFLNQVMPNYSIISVGKNNTYGHPTTALLNRLSYINSKILRTDIVGTIVVNVSSLTNEEAEINFYFSSNIKIEYVIAGLVLINGYLCFFVKYKSTKKQKK